MTFHARRGRLTESAARDHHDAIERSIIDEELEAMPADEASGAEKGDGGHGTFQRFRVSAFRRLGVSRHQEDKLPISQTVKR
jgi:hypothetical protein